jgi:hypothetical protein
MLLPWGHCIEGWPLAITLISGFAGSALQALPGLVGCVRRE